MSVTNRSKKCVLAMVLMAVVLMVFMSTPARAATNYPDFNWSQATTKYTVYLGRLTPGSDINTSGVKFFAVATSPTAGEYSVVLQYKGAFGIYHNVDGNYGYRTGYQSSERRYDPVNGGYVYGQPNLWVWSTNKDTEYRVILEYPTAPQNTVFTRVQAWAYR